MNSSKQKRLSTSLSVSPEVKRRHKQSPKKIKTSKELVEHSLSNVVFPEWPEGDLQELLRRMESDIPQKDTLRHDSRAERLNWKEISFGDYTPEECKDMWNQISKRLRRFRLLKEMLEDARTWVIKPWTNFYRSQKQNRHPDLPKRPLSTYMLFYMEKKDKVAKENPGLEMTGVSKHIAEMYKRLSDRKKQKYIDMAATQRSDYEGKLVTFYQDHPDLLPKPPAAKEPKTTMLGPKKPITPFKIYCKDKLERSSHLDRNTVIENCRQQWKVMPDKKKAIWINWALEEEAKYQDEMKSYTMDNPEFVPAVLKPILTKEERSLMERVAGKPNKPPNSGYSLFSRCMLGSGEIKTIAPKERMAQISKLWKEMSDEDKKKYQLQVNLMLDQYKLDYATYLESLPEEKRAEELQNNQPKRKLLTKSSSKPKTTKVESAKKKKGPEKTLFKGEPESPPVNGYQLFLKTFLTQATHLSPEYREKEAVNCWEMLSDDDKSGFRKRLFDVKQKYIRDYEKFLKSLSQEELKEYSKMKSEMKRDEVATSSEDGSASEASSDNEDGEEEDDDDDVAVVHPKGQSSESGESSSEAGSDSDSDSGNSDSDNSGKSSSDASDSD